MGPEVTAWAPVSRAFLKRRLLAAMAKKSMAATARPPPSRNSSMFDSFMPSEKPFMPASGFMDRAFSRITSVLLFPTVFMLAPYWRLKFTGSNMSWSAILKFPTPILASVTRWMPPTPPRPATATLALRRRSCSASVKSPRFLFVASLYMSSLLEVIPRLCVDPVPVAVLAEYAVNGAFEDIKPKLCLKIAKHSERYARPQEHVELVYPGYDE